jgi:hypothetical protein
LGKEPGPVSTSRGRISKKELQEETDPGIGGNYDAVTTQQYNSDFG